MPQKWTKPTEVEPPRTAVENYCVGVKIRLPREGDRTVTFYYEALDADGRLVEQRPVHVPLSDLASHPSFQTVYDALKAVAYANSPWSGGTVE